MPEFTGKRTLFFTMVYQPFHGWARVGPSYVNRKTAQGWLWFVRGAWRGCDVRISQFTARWIDGNLDARSVGVLNRKFNMYQQPEDK
jgi:hypothetical protein